MTLIDEIEARHTPIMQLDRAPADLRKLIEIIRILQRSLNINNAWFEPEAVQFLGDLNPGSKE